MKLRHSLPQTVKMASLSLLISASLGAPIYASAPPASNKPTTSSTSNTNSSGHCAETTVAAVISESDGLVAKRLTLLQKQTAKVAAMTNAPAADKQLLTTQLAAASTGLTALQAKIDADTKLATVKADCVSIFTGYRVYLLVVPKIAVSKVADDQQSKEASLELIISILQGYVNNSAQRATLEPQLADALKLTQQAQTVSQTAENTVLPLQPSDYNANHQLMTDYFSKLKSAQTSLSTANKEAKAVYTALEKEYNAAHPTTSTSN